MKSNIQEERDWQSFTSFMHNDIRVEHVEICEFCSCEEKKGTTHRLV